MSIDIKSLVKTTETSRAFEYPGIEGFIVTLVYLGRSKMRSINNKCTVSRFKGNRQFQTVDEAMMAKELSTAAVTGWDGLKVKHMKLLMPVQLGDTLKAEDLVKYTEENAELLMEHSIDFGNWVEDIILDIQRFTLQDKKSKEAIEGNLPDTLKPFDEKIQP